MSIHHQFVNRTDLQQHLQRVPSDGPRTGTDDRWTLPLPRTPSASREP